MSEPTYIPGTCNIGPSEIALRRRLGLVSTAVFVVAAALLLLAPVDRIFRVFLFLPALAGALGLLQAAFHFCAAYGLSGFYNVLMPAGKTETVDQQAFRAADRRKALTIFLYSLLISGVTTALVYKV